MKSKIRFVMKSGYAFTVLCDNMKAKTIGNEISGYSIDGIKGSKPMYIRIEDIDAVIDDGEVEE